MSDCMHFPDTIEEFMEQYKMTDTKQVYSNGTEYVPIFRMEQWFEHEKAQLSQEDATSDTIDRQAVIKVLECWQKAFKENSHHASASDLSLVVKDIRALSATHVATDTNVGDKISKFIDGLEEIFADLRERHVDDSVCGLCEYDGAYMGQSGDWCNECPGFNRDDCFKLSEETRKKWTEEIITICKHVGNNSEIPNSSDCISRQAAIDALAKFVPYAICDESTESYTNGLTDAYNLICQLPPAQPEPQWIPVERELPEEYGEYLVTKRIIGWNYEEYDVNDIAYFDDDGFHKADRVIAWMPLPEVYKPNK